ncbi:MAG: hypothetical protein NXI04_27515 [Planctomycetaceae bacterium]|nr:hypothetical protein [Planctomycetaceae bacterium]
MSEDELPDYVELTPELVEEEAIRGDFMLRWASIFLAVLFGFSEISDTRTLVHIRSGEQMQNGSFLPPSADPFAYSLDGQSTPNVSWLFDHAVHLAFSAGGELGLTLFKAFLAGLIAYVLSLISVSGLPTWWNSICGVLAICAVSIDFLPITDIVTALGLVTLMLMLHRHHEGTLRGLIWKVPVLIAVWANLDSRAYLGVVTVALFAAGATITRKSSDSDAATLRVDTSSLWKACGISVAALLANPAPLASLMSVVTTYTVEYPNMRAMKPLSVLLDGASEYHAIWVPEVLQGLEFAYLMAMATVVVAVVALLISRDRQDWPWVVTLAGLSLVGFVTVRELPLVALVAAVAASTAAQRWYARTFRQEYSIETKEVMFSRGGRAVTVLGMALLGFLVVADRLPTRSPVGIGFEADLATTISSLEEQFTTLPEDANILPTRFSQGDLLIWNGRRTYVDSRAALFGRYADETSVVRQFDSLRKGLVAPPEDTSSVATAGGQSPDGADLADGADSGDESATEEPAAKVVDWKSEFEQRNIDLVMLRLSPPGPIPYRIVNAFIQSQDWRLTNRGPSAAFFAVAADSSRDDSFDILDVAFAEEEDLNFERVDFGREKDFYQEYLYKSRPSQSAALRDARHYYTIDASIPPQIVFNLARALGADARNSELMAYIGRVLAGPTMVVRRASQALVEEPQNASAYWFLGQGYLTLNRTESGVVAPFGGQQNVENLRYYQAVAAFRQATVIEPGQARNWEILMQIYQSRGRIDLALDCMEKFLAIEEDSLLSNPDAEDLLRSMYDQRKVWKEQLETTTNGLAEAVKLPLPDDPAEAAGRKFQIVQELNAAGFALMALQYDSENQEALRGIPAAELLRGQLLLESGEVEEAYSVLVKLAAIARESRDKPEYATLQWHTPVAIAHLTRGAYQDAVEVWSEQLAALQNVENVTPPLIQRLTQTLPLVPDVEGRAAGGFGKWPLLHLESTRVPMDALPRGRAQTTMYVAVANLEAGNMTSARQALKELVAADGSHPQRVLSEIYFAQVEDDAIDVIADSTMNVWEEFEFPELNEGPNTDAGDAPDLDAQEAGAQGSQADASTTEQSQTPAPSGSSDAGGADSGNDPSDGGDNPDTADTSSGRSATA